MVHVRIEDRPAFRVAGKKTWIEGTDPDQFGRFWRECSENGLLELLAATGLQPGLQTGGMYLGVSCVETDPSVRDFFFIVSAECEKLPADGLELYEVPACRWAVFHHEGCMPEALIEAEMYALRDWLPASGYIHAKAPEMEVYPPGGEGEDMPVEFWLPVIIA